MATSPTALPAVARIGGDAPFRWLAGAWSDLWRAPLRYKLGYFFGPPTLGLIAGAFGLRMAFVFAALMLLMVLVLAPIMARTEGRAPARA